MGPKSSATIPKSDDIAMDKASSSNPPLQQGISIRNGPMEEMEVDGPVTKDAKTNGGPTNKRKSRQSMTNGKSYKEGNNEADEDDKPLVWAL